MSKILLLSALALCGTTLCQTAAATEYGTMVTAAAAAGVEMKWFCFTPALGIVIPAQAGIQRPPARLLDSRLRGNDGGSAVVAPRLHGLRVTRGAM